MTTPDPVVKRGYREAVLEEEVVAQVVTALGDRAQAIAAELATHLTETARVLGVTSAEVLDLLVGEAPPLSSYRVTLDCPVPPAQPRRRPADARARRRAARRARRLNRP